MSTQNIIDVTPFEPLILKVKYDKFDWEKLEPVCEQLVKDSPFKVNIENDNGRSSVSNPKNPHTLSEFREFYTWLQPYANHIIKKEWKLLSTLDYVISNSWVNYHLRGGITKEHLHGGAVMVIATYLNVPNNSGYIEFKHPLETQKGFYLHEEDDGLWNWKTIQVKTGDVLMFPGWIRHRTQPSNSDEKRWVLTTNITSQTPNS
jgi:uncharacterized protein (TIGR02466 family)